MSPSAKKAERKDAFTLSMVDLFGCGFIAAIFLFILNMMQPALDATANDGLAAGLEGGQAALFSGQSGSAFILVSATHDLEFLPWGAGAQPVVREDENEMLRYNFEQFVTDIGQISWPMELLVQPKGLEMDRWVNLQVTFIFGTSVTSVAVQGWDALSDGPLPVTFRFDGSVRPQLGKPFAHQLTMDVLPERTDGIVYGYRALIASDSPVRARLDWIGPSRRVSWEDNSGIRHSVSPGEGVVCSFSPTEPAPPAICGAEREKANTLNERLSRSVLSVGPAEERG